MIGTLFDRLRGYETLRLRADQHYLSGHFEHAQSFYTRALSVLPRDDARRATVEALQRDCDRRDRMGEWVPVVEPPRPEPGDGAYREGLHELFELAIAEKGAARAARYRELTEEFKRGYLALVQGDALAAVEELRTAAAEADGSAVAQMELGRALSLAGDLEEARARLEQAERLAPDDAEATILLAAVNVELGRFDAAHERLAGLGDESPERAFLLGRALVGLKRPEAALEKFRETVRLEPHFHEAYFEGARLVGASGDRQAQLGLLSRACGLAPDEVKYNRELASLVVTEALDVEPGLAACDRLMVTDEENAWQYLHWIAELYIRRGWTREARDPLTKALGLVPLERRVERHQIESRLRSLGC